MTVADTAAAQLAPVERWNATSTSYPRDACLAELFARRSAEAPDACAVVEGERRCSYEELDQRSNAFAHTLGVGVGQPVGVLGCRSLDAVIAFLAIVKAGGVYVPLDAAYPQARLDAMAAALDLRHVILLPGCDRRLERDAQILSVGDELRPDPPSSERPVTGGDLAYAMFTSGSTGQSKAVGIRQRGITRLVVNTDYVDLDAGDRLLHASSLSFDASTFEIWGALLNGGRLVVADTGVLFSPADLRQLLEAEAVTTAFLSTAVFHYLARAQPDVFRSLHTLLIGGETLDPELARRVIAAEPPRRLVNVYGPTENTTFTSAYPLTDLPPDAASAPIGRPIANTTAYVLRDDGSLADVGEQGELVTGGDGVASGYVNDPQLSAQRFIPDGFSADPDARLYRTGDLAAWSPEGQLEFHGRRDAQFKLHGHRVEPGEIEAALRQDPAIEDAVVVRSAFVDGSDAQILAYLVGAEGGAPPSAVELRERLLETLPSYMVPAAYITLDELPLSPNGKVDRAALIPGETERVPERTATAVMTRAQAVIDEVRGAWRQVLAERGVESEIGPHDTFFDVGGTSFDVPNVHARVTATLDPPGLRQLDLFAYPTLQGYTEHILERLATPRYADT